MGTGYEISPKDFENVLIQIINGQKDYIRMLKPLFISWGWEIQGSAEAPRIMQKENQMELSLKEAFSFSQNDQERQRAIYNYCMSIWR